MERARKAYDLPRNPIADVDRIRISYDAAHFDFYSPEEVYALARAAAFEQDAALFLTAAFAGLRRGELVALLWRDVDFEKRSIRVEGSFSHGAVTRPRAAAPGPCPWSPRWRGSSPDSVSGGTPRGATIPCSRARSPATSTRRRCAGGFIAARDAAGLRPLRFHDLRHTFGSLAINRASIVQVQAWMGMRTRRRRCATCTTRAKRTRPSCSRTPSGRRRRPSRSLSRSDTTPRRRADC
jgi:integrase